MKRGKGATERRELVTRAPLPAVGRTGNDPVPSAAKAVTEGLASGKSAPLSSPGADAAASFPIVAVGASAGGLEAFTELLAHLPANSGMAFVLIQHLDASHESFLAEVLSRATKMPVTQVADRETVEPNHVYVIPPDADLSIDGGALRRVPRAEVKAYLHLPIDAFFAALAAERGSRAIGVVLSGTASDGTEGLKAIRAAGGITFVQDPRTAKFDGMPTSAISAGVVDHVLAIADLANELMRLSHHPYLVGAEPTGSNRSRRAGRPAASQTVDPANLPPSPPPSRPLVNGKRQPAVLSSIMDLVKSVAGIDFKEYKLPTFERRLARRMALRKSEDVTSYLELMRGDPAEVRALCEDTLIHVSSFFRDPEVFETLETTVFPGLIERKAEGAPIRVWVAGCSTGEEVYSLAISLLERLAGSPTRHPLQIFGSDVSEQAIQTARAGRYADGAMRGMSDERCRRYFNKMETGYRIDKSVRDICVFVRHDLSRDPPFSKLDLLSCRNVLIYFNPALQARVLQTFHYSLNKAGFLSIGSTEDIAGLESLFTPIAPGSKIFVRSATPSQLRFAARTEAHPRPPRTTPVGIPDPPRRGRDLGTQLDQLLLARYAPPGILINDRLDVLQFRGQTGSYLQAAPGEPQNNLVKMARPGLLPRLHAAVARAKKNMSPARVEGVEVDQDGFTRTCDLVVLPFAEATAEEDGPLFVVIFEDPSPAPAKLRPLARSPVPATSRRARDAQRLPKLEHELSATTKYLHTLIEEHSRTSDDLGSANEELMSGNEELQSLNEELETAKEELQSTNEELTTVNDELQHRNLEVGQINNDLVNLLDTVDIPIVIVDRGRRIRRFTPKAPSILNVLPSDVGRLFDDIRPRIDAPHLDQQIAEVIADVSPRESEVRDREGRWYRMQIRPYKTGDGRIDGAVISLVDIDALKHHLRQVEQAREDAERADQAKDQFLAVLSHELRTPLSALLLATQLLRQADPADVIKIARACAVIERSTKVQVQLVDDLLDVSRIVTGKLKIEAQPVDLLTVVRATVDTLAPLAESKAIDLRTMLCQAPAVVSGDRLRLEQVVSNLLANAVKFTPRGGRIDVAVESVGGRARLHVTDTGGGIAPEFLPRIFDRLTQSDSSSTRSHSGLGLGLAIVRHLVNAHGGTVTAVSEGLGLGSHFCVELPLMAGAASSPPELVSRGEKSAREEKVADRRGLLDGTRLLVVEDDENIREVLAEMLSRAGAIVCAADSAAAGMSELRSFRPQVILSDIAMPGEDGLSFIRQVRACGPEGGGDTPALALTALAGESDRQRALAGGFDACVVKPVDIERLIDAIVVLLQLPPDLRAAEPRIEPQGS